MNSAQKVKLSGGPDNTVTQIWLDSVVVSVLQKLLWHQTMLEESKIGFRVEIEGWA